MKESAKWEIHKELKTQYHGEVDRISDLPDHVLLNIISLLPIRLAVTTCILSKRWEDVWIGTKAIDLSDCSKISSEDYPSFKIFLDKVRLSKDAHYLELVNFNIYGEIDSIHASEWITSLMKRGIRKLELSNRIARLPTNENLWQDKELLSLRGSFFTSHELVELKLCGKLSICFPSSLQFPLLKVICLFDIHFLDGGSTKNLLSGCPILEKLHIKDCYGEGDLVLHSSSLKTVDISNTFWSSGNISIDAPILDKLSITDFMSHCVIIAPNLRDLFLSTYFIKYYFMNNMPLLVDAYLSISSDGEKVSETLHRVSSSKSLILDGRTIVSIEDNDHRLPIFSNLMRLEVMMFSWPVVLHFLEHSPNLKDLVMCFEPDEERLVWSSPSAVPDCMHALEQVEIQGFDGDLFIFQLIEYIFSKAKFLKQLLVRVDSEHEIEKILEALVMIPSVCFKCEIIVYYY